MKEIIESFIETVESKKIVLTVEVERIEIPFDLIDFLKLISEKRIVTEFRKLPFLTKEEFIKKKVKPYGSRHIVTQSNRVVNLKYTINDEIYTFYALEETVYLCKESKRLETSIQNIKKELHSVKSSINKLKTLLESIDKMSKEAIILLLKEQLQTDMSDYKLSKSSRTRLRETSKELLIEEIKTKQDSLKTIQDTIIAFCVKLGIGKTPTYRNIKKGLQIAINIEYQRYISASEEIKKKEDVLKKPKKIQKETPQPSVSSEETIFTYFPTHKKIIIKGDFNPIISFENILHRDLFSKEINENIWDKLGWEIERIKGAKRRNFTGKFYNDYQNLIVPTEKINKINKKDFPKGIDEFLLSKGNNYYGFSEKGRNAFKNIYLSLKDEYERSLNDTLLDIKIMNELLKESHHLIEIKAKSGCYTKYSVSQIPRFLWKNMHPPIKDEYYSLYKKTRRCIINGKEGITFRFLKQMTKKYYVDENGKKVIFKDNEATIREWAEIELNNDKARVDLIQHFFLEQDKIIKENINQMKKYSSILGKREIYLFLKESFAKKHKLKQLYPLTKIPDGLLITNNAMRGFPLIYFDDDATTQAEIVIYIEGRWANIMIGFHIFGTRTYFVEHEIENADFINQLDNLRKKEEDYENKSIILDLRGNSFYYYLDQ
jgi:hypothetical protein